MTRRRLARWLIAGALVRFVALPLAGTADVQAWHAWAHIATPDAAATYGSEAGLSTAFGYPPAAVFQFVIADRAYHWIDASETAPRTFNVLIKLGGIIAEMAFLALLLRWGSGRFGSEPIQRVALAFWFNPAILLAGAILGYFDVQTAATAALALWSAAAGWPVAAGILAVVAALTKPQGVLLVPAVALIIWNRRGSEYARAIGGAALAVAVLVAPFALRGTLGNILPAMTGSLPDMASGQGANIWWILTWWSQPSQTDIVHLVSTGDLAARGYPNGAAIGMGMAVLAIIWGVWRSRRVSALADGALVAAWCVHAYFTLSIGVHENHLALAVPFLVVAGLRAERRGLGAAVSLIAAANMLLFYGLGENGWRGTAGYPQLAMPVLAVSMLAVIAWTAASLPVAARAGLISVVITLAAVVWLGDTPRSLNGIRMAAGVDLTLLLSFVNLAVFAWHTRTLWRTTAAASALRNSASIDS